MYEWISSDMGMAQRVSLHRRSYVTSLLVGLLSSMASPRPHPLFKTKSSGDNDCTGSTVRRGGYLVAVLIHKEPAGLVPV